MALRPAIEEDEALAVSRYARVAGVLMLLSIVFGFLGEMYLPGKIIVSRDAAATAANIVGQPTLFRLTFAAYLVEGLCDIALCVVFYILLRPVDRRLALMSAFFGMASMILFAVAQASFFSASVVFRDGGGMESFTPEQRNALAYLAIRISGTIAWLFLCLYGIASILRGWLIARSWYLPRIFGWFFILGGTGFCLRSLTHLLVPQYSSFYYLLPMALAGIPTMLWLLIKEIDPARVRAQA